MHAMNVRSSAAAQLAIVVSAGLAAAAAFPMGIGAAATCRPLGGLQTRDIATMSSGARLEVTEYLGGGGYRVSYCSTAGALQRSQHVEAVAVPGGTAAMLPVTTFRAGSGEGGGSIGSLAQITYADPDDPAFARQWPTVQLGAAQSTLPPTQPVSPAGTPAGLTPSVIEDARRVVRPPAAAAGTALGDSCRNRQYAYNGLRIFAGAYRYRANLRRMPHGDADRREITAGHHAFNDTINDCGLSDRTSVVAAYAGTTTATAHSYPDGINVVDFGEIANVAGGCGGQSAGVLACTWGQTRDGVYFADIDQRYATGYLWAGDGAADRYDLRSVAAHESGHAVGLDHANSSRYLTMYHQIARGERWKRALALGDTRGLRCRYGVTVGGC
jgi:hypothetical protein